MKMAVCWDVAPRSLVNIDRRFRGIYCLFIVLIMEVVITIIVFVKIFLLFIVSSRHVLKKILVQWTNIREVIGFQDKS
jgi:hypothetical protein